MSNKTISFRFEDELMGLLDACTEHQRQQTGFAISRADVVKMALYKGLAEMGFPATHKGASSKRTSKAPSKRGKK